MLRRFQVPIGWWELLKRTARETVQDDALGVSAQLAYYFFLALFPALLGLVALASLFPLEHFTDDLTRMMAPFVPTQIVELIRRHLLQIAAGEDAELFSLGIAGALWSSSAATAAVISAMNRAYDLEDTRPWWKKRLTAILLTVGLAVFILVSFTLVVAGPEIADALAARLGLGWAFAVAWKILQWPLIFLLVATAMGLVYYFAPDAEQDWVWITPGAVLATSLWLIASLGFRFYVVNFGNYEAAYGTIGGIIVLLLWFYLSGLVMVIGAEMNSEIERASPWGKDPGEKVPGERRAIGAAAARAYHARGSGRQPPVTSG
jgi:membrane protein